MIDVSSFCPAYNNEAPERAASGAETGAEAKVVSKVLTPRAPIEIAVTADIRLLSDNESDAEPDAVSTEDTVVKAINKKVISEKCH